MPTEFDSLLFKCRDSLKKGFMLVYEKSKPKLRRLIYETEKPRKATETFTQAIPNWVSVKKNEGSKLVFFSRLSLKNFIFLNM